MGQPHKGSRPNQAHRITEKQVSAGGVVFKEEAGSFLICLVARRRLGKLIWCLPKGHIETGEALTETALREVKEETGLSGKPVSPLGTIEYTFYDSESNKEVHKTVHFFLMRFERGCFDDHDDEVEDARWFPVSEALQTAEYAGERDVLARAMDAMKDA